MVYGNLGQHRQAISYHEQALAIARAVGNRAGEGIALNNLGLVFYALGQHTQAMQYLEQALGLLREVGKRVDEAGVAGNLMFVWKRQQKPRLAIFYGKQAITLLQAIRGDLQALDQTLQRGFVTSKAAVYRTLAELLITEGRLSEAQQVLDLLKEEEYFDFVRRDAQAAATLQGRATLTPEEAAGAQRSQEIAERVTALGRERRDLRAKQGPAEQGKDLPLSEAEMQRLTALDAELDVARAAFHTWLAELQAAFSSTPASSNRLAELDTELGLQSDLAELGPDTVLLYTLVTDTHYRVIVITPETQVARDYPITAAALNCKVHAFREVLRTLGDGAPEFDPRPLAQELYQILVGPVAKDLEGAHAQTLLWNLDGVLRYLPVAALHDGTHYMVERYRTVIYTRVSKARLKDLPRPTWTGVGLGVSKAHAPFDPLPAVPTELRGIIRDTTDAPSGVLAGTIKLDEAFTEATMTTALKQGHPVVHIASHFHLHPGNNTASFLLLGDGSRLSLAQLQQKTTLFHGVDLLTLSACNTAMGDLTATGTEIDGFARQAQRQGAKAVVASLWPVADRSTQVLMQSFYRRREGQPGLPKVEALRQAQLALLRGQEAAEPAPPVAVPGALLVASTSEVTEPRGLVVMAEHQAPSACNEGAVPLRFRSSVQSPYAHPFYWAPFILIGNWK
jgi:CHAT domain-containing protein